MRKPRIFVSCEYSYIDNMNDYEKKYYNKNIFTSKTIKKPYGCPNGRRKCPLCTHKDKNKVFQYKNSKFLEDDYSMM